MAAVEPIAALPVWARPYQAAWFGVLCLIALDYLSTLGYQPSLAYQAAGRLAPLATLGIVAATLFGALPVYLYIAGRSPHGGGAVALLERLIPGWKGKLLVVILLGFMATDFVITRTFSTAAAAEHIIHNPIPAWQETLDGLARGSGEYGRGFENPAGQWLAAHSTKQLVVTLGLLLAALIFSLVFLKGFTRRVVRLAAGVVLVYLTLNAIVIGSGLVYLARHSEIVSAWLDQVKTGQWKAGVDHGPQGWIFILIACILAFPKLALGLSGLETVVGSMPLIRGRPDDDPAKPRGRIAATRKLLIAATLLGAWLLLSSSFVVTLLVPAEEFAGTGSAAHRALAYLAHGELMTDDSRAGAMNPLFGLAFGTVYDGSAVLMLCLAGASMTVGLRDLVPPYLHRLGMEFRWSAAMGVLVYLFTAIKLVVTIVFRADLEKQSAAYATSVLAVLTAAALVAGVDRRRFHATRSTWARTHWLFWSASGVFGVSLLAVMLRHPSGAAIALGFVVTMLTTSMMSRALRSTELRFEGFDFVDDESKRIFEHLTQAETPMLMLDPPEPGVDFFDETEKRLRAVHRLPPDVPCVFIEPELADASEFQHRPLVHVRPLDHHRFVIHVTRCVSVAHVVAAIALELAKGGPVPEVHFDWSNERPLTANLHFLLFGHGNVPWMVQYLLRRAQRDPARRPRVIVG